jgi:hypothetical protein
LFRIYVYGRVPNALFDVPVHDEHDGAIMVYHRIVRPRRVKAEGKKWSFFSEPQALTLLNLTCFQGLEEGFHGCVADVNSHRGDSNSDMLPQHQSDEYISATNRTNLDQKDAQHNASANLPEELVRSDGFAQRGSRLPKAKAMGEKLMPSSAAVVIIGRLGPGHS